jgi:aminoglycoside 3-N-acetyltransferase
MDLKGQLRALGVREGGILLVHTSFRAVGPVEGGPLGLVDALGAALGPEGTLVMPAMSDGEHPFDPQTTPSSGMGITAELFRTQPGVVRSTHPGGSFSARGPLAERICAPQPLEPPHGKDSPPGRVHELGGQVLLLGVAHDASTTLHVAESIARVPYSIAHPCVLATGERVLIRESDHCCRNFNLVDGWLRERGLVREGRVGNATAKLADARDIVAVALPRLERDPLVFLCAPERRCEECDAARASAERRDPS